MTAGSELHITPYRCPMPGCVGGLVADDTGSADRCLHCAGSGLTDDPMGGADRAPRPPAVMGAPCGDCAFRQGSPELENAGVTLPEDEPFFCHTGMPVSASGQYQPVATFRGLPLGAMVCAGWWAMRTGQPLPVTPFREKPLGEKGVDREWGRSAQANIERLTEKTPEERERALIAMGLKLGALPVGELRVGLAMEVAGYRMAIEAAQRHQTYVNYARVLGVSIEKADAALSEAFTRKGTADAKSAYAEARNVLAGGRPTSGGPLEGAGTEVTGPNVADGGQPVDSMPGPRKRERASSSQAAALLPVGRMTKQMCKVLRVLLDADRTWGKRIVIATGLPSGTVYPILARLKKAGWVTTERESQLEAHNRPRRNYIQLTPGGRAAANAALARKREGQR